MINEEEGRKIILSFLKNKEPEKFTINSLFKSLNETYPEFKFTYYLVAVMTENLIASGQIKSADFGYKVVWYETEHK
jgi:hypothetical protein